MKIILVLSPYHVFCATPSVILRSDFVTKHPAQLVLLSVENTVSIECDQNVSLFPFLPPSLSLEEEAGTTTCSPCLKLLSKKFGEVLPSALVSVTGLASLVSGVSVEPASLPALGFLEN